MYKYIIYKYKNYTAQYKLPARLVGGNYIVQHGYVD